MKFITQLIFLAKFYKNFQNTYVNNFNFKPDSVQMLFIFYHR